MLGLPRPTLSTRGPLALLGLVLAALAACRDTPTAPRETAPPPTAGRLVVYAALDRLSGVDGIVIDVSGPGIVKRDGTTPDTLSYNLTVSGGVASGSIEIPAGDARVVTAHAFQGVVETHRGTRTGVHVAEGVNPTLDITLLPLVGAQPITLTFGTTIVTVSPATFSLLVGDTTRLSAEVRDQTNTVLTGAKVRWASLNPGRAMIDTLGLLTVRDTGDVQIVATYGTVGGSAKGRGIARADTTSQPGYALRWNGSVSREWTDARNWTPGVLGVARVPSATDSVFVPSTVSNQPRTDCSGHVSARDLVFEAGASLIGSCGYGVRIFGRVVVPAGAMNVDAYLYNGARPAGAFNRLYVYGDVTLGDSVRATYVEVNATDARLVLGGRKLVDAGDFNVFSNAVVTVGTGDTLVIRGNVNWQGGDHAGRIDGGVVQFYGTNFYGYRYKATGTNRLQFLATSGARQQIYGFNYASEFARASLQKFEIANAVGAYIDGGISVSDTFRVATPVVVANSSCCYAARALGPIVTVAGSEVSNYQWEVRHPSGLAAVAGMWRPTYTDFDVENATVLTGPGARYVNLRFFASNALPDSVRATGHVWVDGSGVNLSLGGHALHAGDYFDIRNGATLTMTSAADTLDVASYVAFQDAAVRSAHATKLTNGVILAGNYFYGLGFDASGAHTVRLTGRGASDKYVSGMNYEARDQGFQNLEVDSLANYGMCERVRVRGTLRVRNGATVREWCGGSYLRVDGKLATEAASVVNSYLVALYNANGTDSVAGAWTPAHTDFDAIDIPVKPGLGYQNLRFFARNSLKGPTNAAGYLWLDGAAVNLRLGGSRVNVGDYLDMRNGAQLTMDNAADTLDVAGRVEFRDNNSAAHAASITAGVIRVGGYFNGQGFAASGTNKVVLTALGPGDKYITSVNFESRPAQAFNRLEFASGTMGLCERVRVKDSLTVRAGATVQNWCGNPIIRPEAAFTVETGATWQPYDTQLGNARGTLDVAGVYQPTWTSVVTALATSALKPGLAYQNLAIYAPVTLADSLTLPGQLYMSGSGASLAMNGKRLTVGSTLNMDNSAKLLMTNPADSLELQGDFYYDQGGSHVGEMSAGTIVMSGVRFVLSSFYATGTHRVIFDRRVGTGETLPRVEGVSGSGQPMQNVIVRGNGLQGNCHIWVQGWMRVEAGRVEEKDCGVGDLWVNDTLVVLPGAQVTNGDAYAINPSSERLDVVMYSAEGTKWVTGGYDPSGSLFLAPGAYIQPSRAGLQYRYLRVDRSTQLRGRTVATGAMDVINDALLDVNGQTLEVWDQLNFDNTARFKMTNAQDSVIVKGANFYYDGASDPSQLTRGTVAFRGDRFVGTAFQVGTTGLGATEPMLKMILGDSSGAPMGVEGAPTFGRLVIDAPAGVLANDRFAVQDSLLLKAGTLSASTYVNTTGGRGGFTSLPGTDVTAVSFYLDDSTGTRDVGGRFRPTNTFFRAGSPMVAGGVKPSLEYGNVRFSSPTMTSGSAGVTYQLSGRTKVGGSLDVDQTGTLLDLAGNTLVVGGNVEVYTNGILKMASPLDSMLTSGSWRVGASAGMPELTAGVVTDSGSFFHVERNGATVGTKIVLKRNGGGQQDFQLDPGGFGTTPVGDVVFLGSSGVRFTRGGRISGTFADSSTGPKSNASYVELRGATTSSASAAPFTFGEVGFYGPNGSNDLLGGFTVTGTATYGTTGGVIRSRPGVTHTNITIAATGVTVNGDSLGLNGNLTINGGVSFTLPARSRAGSFLQNTGSLTFGGDATFLNYLENRAGGTMTIPSGATVRVVDLYLRSGSTCTNNGALRYSAVLRDNAGACTPNAPVNGP